MAFEPIEQLKLAYTDKYVRVAADRPELARFGDAVGRVKTINMSGRALVEFENYLNNPAWHDLPLAALRVVEKPPEPAPAAKKPAAEKAPAKPAAKKPAADVIAAARGGAKKPGDAAAGAGAGDKQTKRTSPSVGKSTADILAAARGGPAKASEDSSPDKPSGKLAGKKPSPSVGLSTADVLAAARGQKPAEPDSPAEPAENKKPPAPKQASASGMTTEEILAAARAAKTPAEDEPKPSAMDELESSADRKQPAPRRKLTAEDIRDIGLGKLSVRREQPIATEPLKKKPKPEAGDAKPEALPEKLDATTLTAEDIYKLGGRK